MKSKIESDLHLSSLSFDDTSKTINDIEEMSKVNFRSIATSSIRSKISCPATPRLSPRTISLSGSQGFIFSLHNSRDERCSKFIANLMSLYPGMVSDLNSQDALLNFLEQLGIKYFTYLQNKKNFTKYCPIPDFASDLKACGLEQVTNINDEILKQIRSLIHKGARTINYFGDFNSGRTGMNVTHMESLRTQLASKEFTHSTNGIKVLFDLGDTKLESGSAQIVETVFFRPFMSGSGGEDKLFFDPIYRPINHEEAKKKYSYNSFIAPFAIVKIETLLKEQIKQLSVSAPCSPSSTAVVSIPSPSSQEMKPSSHPQSFFSVAPLSDLEAKAIVHYQNLMGFTQHELDELYDEELPKAPHTSPIKPKSVKPNPSKINYSRKKLNFDTLFTALADLSSNTEVNDDEEKIISAITKNNSNSNSNSNNI
ncbi:MAG: hypothetical protein PSV35_09775 [bacterium]|nr:hypothetical protein [bacterium]